MQRDLVVTEDGRRIRSKVGPVAWVVLEELVTCGEDRPRSVEASTTVRELGDAVGLSKDTVASGLRRLMGEGLVTREDQRDRASGCFGNSVYRVALPETGLRKSSPDGPEPDRGFSDTANGGPKRRSQTSNAPTIQPTSARREGAKGTAAVPSAQMSLLDASLSSAVVKGAQR